MTDEFIGGVERIAFEVFGGIIIVAILFALYLGFKMYFTGRNGGE